MITFSLVVCAYDSEYIYDLTQLLNYFSCQTELINVHYSLQGEILTLANAPIKKKLGRVGKDRPTGINLRRSLGFPDRENPRTLGLVPRPLLVCLFC